MTSEEIIVVIENSTHISSGPSQGPHDPIPSRARQVRYFWTPEGKRFIAINSQLMCP
jgi:hypothetical protein